MNFAVTSAPETHLIILSRAKHTLTSLHHHIATAAALQTQFPSLCITGSSERSRLSIVMMSSPSLRPFDWPLKLVAISATISVIKDMTIY